MSEETQLPASDSALLSAMLEAEPTLKEGEFLSNESRDPGIREPYKPTPFPLTMQGGGGAGGALAEPAITRRWSVWGNETDYFLNCGKVFNGFSANETSITDANATLTLNTPGAVWLETGSVSLSSITLESGNVPSDIYEGANGTMTAYRKIIGDVANATMGVGSQRLTDTLWFRPRVGDTDLMATSTVVEIDGNATLAVEFHAY